MTGEAKLPPLCVLSDPSETPDAAGESLLRLLGAGVRWVQLRAKGVADRELFAAARHLAAGAPAGSLVTLNDRCDVALASGLRSVHLGEDDLPVAEARRLLGREAVLGVSTHSAASAAAAPAEADYVAIGPIYESGSKKTARPLLAPAAVGGSVALGVTRPIVAIGGIGEGELEPLFRAGAAAVAVIGAVWRSSDPVASALRIQAACERLRAAGAE